MRLTALLVAALCLLPLPGLAQEAARIVQENQALIEKPSRQTIGPVIAALAASGDAMADDILEAWGDKRLVIRKSDGAVFLVAPEGDGLALTALDGSPAGTAAKADLTELKPNAGVRGLIATALVQFTLSDPDPLKRQAALASIAQDPKAEALDPLRAAIAGEEDLALKAQKERLERLLTLRFDPSSKARVAAIDSFGADIGLDLRGALNPLLATTRIASATPPQGNIARELRLGKDIPEDEAYALLVAANIAPARLTLEDQRTALLANLQDGTVGGIPLADLNTQTARDRAYTALEASGAVPVAATDDEATAALAAAKFYEVYAEPDPAVTTAAQAALGRISTTVGAMQAADLGLDALSLASIYFLAAIGLAITFGVMGVINMAHGEFITIGAYTGYVVQLYIPDHTVSVLIALPLAFAVTFGCGVAMERLVIRHLYKRPLETLLATFGISIALQQILKNVFGTQARPLTSPGWLDGALVFNDVVSISYIRIAIFVLALLFLTFFLWLMKRTRLGLEVRAVTQNPAMAASMGINPDRINMLTFGIGSGIAGIAGVAIGLFAKVTSELGTDYIVQSFMTVVVGGVGNIWGTLAGATMIGGLQKVIEFFNPSNTLAAQTYMILFIILFIQFRGDLGEKPDGDPGDACDAGADAEGQHVDAVGVDAHAGSHRGVLRHRADLQPQAGAFHQPEEEGQEQKRQHEDRDADVADRHHVVEDQRPIQPTGRGQRAGLGAEDVLQDLLQGDRDAEGGEQGFQRALIKVADHQPFHRHAAAEGDGEGEGQGDQDRNRVIGDVKLDHVAGIGADGDELAMRHVDHAHHTEGDGQTDGSQKVDRGERQGIEAKVGGLHRPDRGADPPKGSFGGGGHGGVGLGVDLVELGGGKGGARLIVGGGDGDGPACLQRGIGAVAGGLGVQVSQRNAADGPILQVCQKGGALVLQCQAGGGDVGGDEKGIGLIFRDVLAQAQLAGDVALRWRGRGDAGRGEKRVQRAAQV
jgi:urea transport system permease protein